MKPCASRDIAHLLSVPIEDTQAEAGRQFTFFHGRFHVRDGDEKMIAHRNGDAMVGSRRFVGLEFGLAAQKRTLLQEIEPVAAIVEDGEIITVRHDMAGLFALDRRRKQLRVFDLDISVLAVVGERDAGIDRMNDVLVALNGKDRAAGLAQ